MIYYAKLNKDMVSLGSEVNTEAETIAWAQAAVANVTGKHDVYFAFTGKKGPKLFNFDWWKLEK